MARRFPAQVVVDDREPALETAKTWRRPDTMWTDGSRQEDGRVGAACVWRTQQGWTGRRYHLGSNKVFDAEVFAVYRALDVIDQRQETGRRYTVFVDSMSATNRVRDDSLGPGQRFAVAAIEVATRITTRDNSVTVWWVPAHSGAEGNEVADRYAKSAATGEEPVEAIPEGYAGETSLSHMTRVATEARSKETEEWIRAHVRPERGYRPPPGRGLKRPPLRRARKTLAGRYYQLLSGHAATAPHLMRVGQAPSDKCWWCGKRPETDTPSPFYPVQTAVPRDPKVVAES